MKKEITAIALSFVAAFMMALCFDIMGGYYISCFWIWELFVLLLAHVLVTRRFIKREKIKITEVLIDISIISILIIGYLVNFRTIEKFLYEESYIIFSRLLIIILYYMICSLICEYGKKIKFAICIAVEWLSIFVVVFCGGIELNNIINDTDNYAKAISGDWIMKIVSYYCMPDAKTFWIFSAIIIVLILIMFWKIFIDSKIQECKKIVIDN